MPTHDHRIDTYISNSAEFAQPILTRIREVVHESCPEVDETMKWSFPHFDYSGSILCSMAAFKQHCAFSFWLGSMMPDPDKLLLIGDDKTSMGHFGPLKSVRDLPGSKTFSKYVKEAMSLIDSGVKAPKKEKASAGKQIEIPDYFAEELKKNKKAADIFNKFSPSHKYEYMEWITDAKTEGTRAKRIATTMEWLTEGKPRNWKYQR